MKLLGFLTPAILGFVFAFAVVLVAMTGQKQAERTGIRAAEQRRSLIASEYFRAGVSSAIMVKVRTTNEWATYDEFLAACQKAWVAVNTNDVGVIK